MAAPSIIISIFGVKVDNEDWDEFTPKIKPTHSFIPYGADKKTHVPYILNIYCIKPPRVRYLPVEDEDLMVASVQITIPEGGEGDNGIKLEPERGNALITNHPEKLLRPFMSSRQPMPGSTDPPFYIPYDELKRAVPMRATVVNNTSTACLRFTHRSKPIQGARFNPVDYVVGFFEEDPVTQAKRVKRRVEKKKYYDAFNTFYEGLYNFSPVKNVLNVIATINHQYIHTDSIAKIIEMMFSILYQNFYNGIMRLQMKAETTDATRWPYRPLRRRYVMLMLESLDFVAVLRSVQNETPVNVDGVNKLFDFKKDDVNYSLLNDLSKVIWDIAGEGHDTKKNDDKLKTLIKTIEDKFRIPYTYGEYRLALSDRQRSDYLVERFFCCQYLYQLLLFEIKFLGKQMNEVALREVREKVWGKYYIDIYKESILFETPPYYIVNSFEVFRDIIKDTIRNNILDLSFPVTNTGVSFKSNVEKYLTELDDFMKKHRIRLYSTLEALISGWKSSLIKYAIINRIPIFQRPMEVPTKYGLRYRYIAYHQNANKTARNLDFELFNTLAPAYIEAYRAGDTLESVGFDQRIRFFREHEISADEKTKTIKISEPFKTRNNTADSGLGRFKFNPETSVILSNSDFLLIHKDTTTFPTKKYCNLLDPKIQKMINRDYNLLQRARREPTLNPKRPASNRVVWADRKWKVALYEIGEKWQQQITRDGDDVYALLHGTAEDLNNEDWDYYADNDEGEEEEEEEQEDNEEIPLADAELAMTLDPGDSLPD